jgi:hypothetical protein
MEKLLKMKQRSSLGIVVAKARPRGQTDKKSNQHTLTSQALLKIIKRNLKVGENLSGGSYDVKPGPFVESIITVQKRIVASLYPFAADPLLQLILLISPPVPLSETGKPEKLTVTHRHSHRYASFSLSVLFA